MSTPAFGDEPFFRIVTLEPNAQQATFKPLYPVSSPSNTFESNFLKNSEGGYFLFEGNKMSISKSAFESLAKLESDMIGKSEKDRKLLDSTKSSCLG